MKAKTIGIVGGIGPEATVDYYRMLLAAFKARGVDDYRSILINSIDLDKALRYLYADDRAGLIEFMIEPVEMLARGGAEVGLSGVEYDLPLLDTATLHIEAAVDAAVR